MLKITSLQNERIKRAIKLKDRRARDEAGLFVIEGYRELKRAVDAKYKIETLFICPEFFLGENEGALIEKAGCEVIECSKSVFEKLSYRDRPDGLIGIAPQRPLFLKDLSAILAKKKMPFLLVAEGIEKPGNLGTILRSSDAAGVDAVIVCDPTTDVFNPNVVRASVGTLFTVPVIQTTNEELLPFLKEKKIQTVAATPHAKREFTKVDFNVPLAVLVGTEQYGLSDVWMKGANLAVKIPMFGVADSLNVASATTLLLYEVVRQRHDT